MCGSNLPVWEGREWFSYPLPPGAPGHEAWGVVEDPADTAVRRGARVAFLAENAFATSVDVDVERMVVLPPSLDGQPFPGEALGCGFNVARRSRIECGQTIAVIGVGFIGAVVVAAAARAGANVVAISRRDFSLEMAKAMGAGTAVSYRDRWQAARDAIDGNGGALFDVVVEAVGAQDPLDLASDLTAEGGRLVVAGYHQDGHRNVDMQLWNWRGIDVINAHERDPRVQLAGVQAAVDAVTDGWFDPAPLYTHRFPLERFGEAMDTMLERPDGFLKALVMP